MRKHIGGQLPIFLFAGHDNTVLYRTMYRWRVILGYGHLHCWMGWNTWCNVFPIVCAKVDRVVHGEAYRFQEPDVHTCHFTRMMEVGEL